jgi:hypothetical protein
MVARDGVARAASSKTWALKKHGRISGAENRPDGAQGVGSILGAPVAAMIYEAADKAEQPK